VRVTGTDRRVSAGRRAGLDYGQLVRGSGELRRRTTTNGNGTSDERGVLEGEATSSRQEWGGSAAFYREREGRRMVCQGEGTIGVFMATIGGVLHWER
jgi:hypothetical protein